MVPFGSEFGLNKFGKEAMMPSPDFHYSGLSREQLSEKQEILQRIFDKYFPGQKEKSFFKSGYIFFPEFNKRVANGSDFRDEYDRVAKPLYFQLPDRYSNKVTEAKEILSSEYKIHLMPKSEYTPFIIEQLLSGIKSDPELRDVISQIKIINDDKKIRKEIMPTIVIYAKLGKLNAQIALDKICRRLGKYRGIGLGQTPRYNQKVNDLIYYAQSGGDWKNDYVGALEALGKSIDDNNPIFDKDFIHFKGDYKLKIPLGE